MTEQKDNSTEEIQEAKSEEKVEDKKLVKKKSKLEKEKAPLWARLFVFMFAIMIAFAIFMSSQIEPTRTNCAEKNAIKQDFILMQKRVEYLEREVEKIKAQPKSITTATTDLSDAVLARIEEVESKVSDIVGHTVENIKNIDMEGLYNSAAFKKVDGLVEELAGVKDKVAELFTEKDAIKEQAEQLNADVKSVVEKQAKGFNALLVFENLKNSMEKQNPYIDELENIKTLLDTTEINWDLISNNANIGIPSVESLTQQFRKYAKKAITTPSNDADWWDKTKSNMSKVVTVRKKGYVEGDDTDAILARAEYKLINNPTINGVKSALSELEELQPDKKAIFNEWIKDAEVLVNTKDILENIRSYILLQGTK